MNKFAKYALIAMTGYLVGWCECKCKTNTALIRVIIGKDRESV